jgi:hypothetical protein
MDSGTLIVGVIILLVCIIPFAYMIYHQKKQQQTIRQALVDFGAQHQSTIHQLDVWNHSAIGLDHTNRLLYFYKKATHQPTPTTLRITLNELRKCRVENSGRTVSSPNGPTNVIDRLELVLSFKDKTKKDVVLEIYNNTQDHLTLNDELPLAERWAALINAQATLAG